MDFMVSAETDIGIVKNTNQDSLSVKIIDTYQGRMAFAIVCDGMGGLQKGEVALATSPLLWPPIPSANANIPIFVSSSLYMICESIKSSLFFLTLPISDAKLKIILLPPFSTCAFF